MTNLQAIVIEPVKTVLTQIGQFLVKGVWVIVLLIIGWLISRTIKTLVTRVLKAIKLDEVSKSIKLDDLLAKGGISYSLSELIGILFYWLAILVTIMVTINAIGLTVAANLLNTVILFIPNVIAAIFILILGVFTAILLSNIVQASASNAGVTQPKLFGKIVQVIVVIFAIAIALEQLKIGSRIIELAIGITLASIGLASAIAFGLGCKDIAAKFLNEVLDNLKSKK